MPVKKIKSIFAGLFFFVIQIAFSQTKPNYRLVPVVDSAVGVASYYADKFVGRATASGEIFSQHKMT